MSPKTTAALKRPRTQLGAKRQSHRLPCLSKNPVRSVRTSSPTRQFKRNDLSRSNSSTEVESDSNIYGNSTKRSTGWRNTQFRGRESSYRRYALQRDSLRWTQATLGRQLNGTCVCDQSIYRHLKTFCRAGVGLLKKNRATMLHAL